MSDEKQPLKNKKGSKKGGKKDIEGGGEEEEEVEDKPKKGCTDYTAECIIFVCKVKLNF